VKTKNWNLEMLVFAMTLAVAKRKSKNADKSYHSNV
jgi:hypothetical protein